MRNFFRSITGRKQKSSLSGASSSKTSASPISSHTSFFTPSINRIGSRKGAEPEADDVETPEDNTEPTTTTEVSNTGSLAVLEGRAYRDEMIKEHWRKFNDGAGLKEALHEPSEPIATPEVSNTESLAVLSGKPYRDEMIKEHWRKFNDGAGLREASCEQSQQSSDHTAEDPTNESTNNKDPHDLSKPQYQNIYYGAHDQQVAEYEDNLRRLREVEQALEIDVNLSSAQRRRLEEEKEELGRQNERLRERWCGGLD